MPIKLEIVIEEEAEGMRWKARRGRVNGTATDREKYQASAVWHALRMIIEAAGRQNGSARIVEVERSKLKPEGNLTEGNEGNEGRK